MYGDLPLRLEPTTETVLVAPRVSSDTIYANILSDLNFADNKSIPLKPYKVLSD